MDEGNEEDLAWNTAWQQEQDDNNQHNANDSDTNEDYHTPAVEDPNSDDELHMEFVPSDNRHFENSDDDDYDTSDDTQTSDEHDAELADAWHKFKERSFVMADEVASGAVDMQGIPWRAMQRSRNDHRENRLKQYSTEIVYKEESLAVDRSSSFFKFRLSAVKEKAHIMHFQLRHLVSVVSKQDIYYVERGVVRHWCPLRQKSSVVLNCGGGVDSSKVTIKVDIDTMSAHDSIVAVGGFYGDLICKNTQTDTMMYTGILSTANITNALTFSENLDGGMSLYASSNDCFVRVLDLKTFVRVDQFPLPWPVNYSELSPNKRMLGVVGDSQETLILDARNGEEALALHGHLDYSFSLAWSLDGVVVATANQDRTTRLYDIRNPSKALAILDCLIGSGRSLRYSKDGRFLAVAEEVDFVHIYDVASGYRQCQTIDMLGEIAGMGFDPDTEMFYIGNADHMFGGLIEFERDYQSPLGDIWV